MVRSAVSPNSRILASPTRSIAEWLSRPELTSARNCSRVAIPDSDMITRSSDMNRAIRAASSDTIARAQPSAIAMSSSMVPALSPAEPRCR
jgi:hypothetical protein